MKAWKKILENGFYIIIKDEILSFQIYPIPLLFDNLSPFKFIEFFI
jgi:hypothetical protein